MTNANSTAIVLALALLASCNDQQNGPTSASGKLEQGGGSDGGSGGSVGVTGQGGRADTVMNGGSQSAGYAGSPGSAGATGYSPPTACTESSGLCAAVDPFHYTCPLVSTPPADCIAGGESGGAMFGVSFYCCATEHQPADFVKAQ